MRTMTFDEFVERYKPEVNLTDETGGSFDGLLFPVGHDYANKVRSVRLWTLTSGDNGRDFIQSGYHRVNRLGYFITQVPFTEDIEVTI